MINDDDYGTMMVLQERVNSDEKTCALNFVKIKYFENAETFK